MAAALFALVAGAATAPAGDLYKWRDANGVLHFSDSPPAEAGKKVETRQVEEGGGGDFDVMKNYPKGGGTSPAARRPAVVTLYTTARCKYCKAAKAFLSARGIPYSEYDVESNVSARMEANRLNPEGGVPVAVINGATVVGFSEASYQRALAGGN